jgi:hypothetical protein
MKTSFNPKRDLSYLAAVIPDWTTILIYSGALANIALWIRAGEMVEKSTWSTVSAWGLGFVMSLGPVQIIKQWAKLEPTIERTRKGIETSKANPRWWIAIGSFSVILASEAVLLSPVIMAMLNKNDLVMELGSLALWWSFGRVLISAIAVGGLAAVLPQKSDTVRPQKVVAIAPVLQTAPKSEPKNAVVRCTEPGCGKEYATKGGKGGHYKKWHKHPAIIGYKVSMEPVVKNKDV